MGNEDVNCMAMNRFKYKEGRVMFITNVGHLVLIFRTNLMIECNVTDQQRDYRHLCSSSTTVTAELFRDDLSRQVKDISKVNCVGQKVTLPLSLVVRA